MAGVRAAADLDWGHDSGRSSKSVFETGADYPLWIILVFNEVASEEKDLASGFLSSSENCLTSVCNFILESGHSI